MRIALPILLGLLAIVGAAWAIDDQSSQTSTIPIEELRSSIDPDCRHFGHYVQARLGDELWTTEASGVLEDGGVELPPELERVQAGLDALADWVASAESIRVKWTQENLLIPADMASIPGFSPIHTAHYDIQAHHHDGILVIDGLISGAHGSIGEEVESELVSVVESDGMMLEEISYVQSSELEFFMRRTPGVATGTASYSSNGDSSLLPMQNPAQLAIGTLPVFAQPVNAFHSRRGNSRDLVVTTRQNGDIEYILSSQSTTYSLQSSNLIGAEIPSRILFTLDEKPVYEQVIIEHRWGLEIGISQHHNGQKTVIVTASFAVDPNEQRTVAYSSVPSPDILPDGVTVRYLDSGLAYNPDSGKLSIPDHPALKEIHDALQ